MHRMSIMGQMLIIFVICICVHSALPALVKPLRCKGSDSNDKIDCSGRELTTSIILVNSEEGGKIRSVDFSNNNIHQIERLERFPKVQNLSFQLNSIEKVPSDAFSALAMLQEVDLSFNNIEHIDPFAFINSKHLRSIILQGNSLQITADKPILCSASLQTLDLGTCALSMITRENLVCLPALTELDLSSNGLTSLTPSVFSPVNHLVSINLRNNRFSCDCQLPELLNWARSKTSDLTGSDPVYCVLPDFQGRTQFEKIEKDLNCSVRSTVPVPSAMKSLNENNSSSESYDYILVSYDTSIQTVDGHVSTRYMGIITSKLYTIEALLSVVLFLLVVITGMLFCRHYRTVGNVSDSVSEYSVYDNFISNEMSTQLIQNSAKEHMYAHVK